MIKKILISLIVLATISYAAMLNYKYNYDDSICGIMSRSAGLIIGGKHSSRSQFPWMAVIAVKNNKHWTHQGSGSLISSRHVLSYVGTVSYPDVNNKWISVSADRVEVFLGVTNKNDLKKLESWTKVGVSKIVEHPNAKMLIKSMTINKIAILTLAHEVTFSEFIRPVCLWPFTEDFIGKNAFAVGYGRDETGRKTLNRKHVHVTIIDQKKCEKFYNKEFQIANETKLFCTIGDGDSGPCIYDDMLYIKVNAHWYLKGILTTSYVFDDGSCVTDRPTLYEDITPIISWIIDQMK
ncbi:hypothetical protein PVAND_000201 [Polypedilum vanderplanki]|uniref:Peptidase S1 domain-containing protein n=1 Tax=Polypedilum vanderplanki TaxID=319348 RepID=A0A9J6BJZ4_POLVA|nr:hypothetical protein PVAND_000201 [Polypedilum vanderplanki]